MTQTLPSRLLREERTIQRALTLLAILRVNRYSSDKLLVKFIGKLRRRFSVSCSMIKSRCSWVVHNRGHSFSKRFTLQGCTTVTRRMFNRYRTKKRAFHGVATRQLSLHYNLSRKPPNLRLTRITVRPILPYSPIVCIYALGRIKSTSWGRDSTFVSHRPYTTE